MKASIYQKLESLVERHEEVGVLLGDPDVIGDQNKFRDLSREYSQLEEVVQTFNRYRGAEETIASSEEMMKDDDADIREMAQEEFKEAKASLESLETELQVLLLPKDPNDEKNTYLEIRAGTGGD